MEPAAQITLCACSEHYTQLDCYYQCNFGNDDDLLVENGMKKKSYILVLYTIYIILEDLVKSLKLSFFDLFQFETMI